jgi:hypothetical protein
MTSTLFMLVILLTLEGQTMVVPTPVRYDTIEACSEAATKLTHGKFLTWQPPASYGLTVGCHSMP